MPTKNIILKSDCISNYQSKNGEQLCVHLSWPKNAKNDFYITYYIATLSPFKILDGMSKKRIKVKRKEDLNLEIEHARMRAIECLSKEDEKFDKKMNSIDDKTKIGKAFISLFESKRLFCDSWNQSTHKTYMNYYKKNVIPRIQYCQVEEDFDKTEFEQLVDKIAESTYANGNFKGHTIEDAKITVIKNLNNCYPIFEELIYMDHRIPRLTLKDDSVAPTKKQNEQIKYIPFPVLKKFRTLLELDIKNKPKLVRAAVLMENTAARTNEAAKWQSNKYEEIDSHVVIWLLNQGENRKMKSENGYRYVVTDDWGTEIIKKCNSVIDESIDSTNDFNEKDLSKYVKKLLIQAGLTNSAIQDYIDEIAEVAKHNNGFNEDVTAYILRRNRASIWRNICGYNQQELDYVLGHRNVYITKNFNDMKKPEIIKKLSTKNRLFDLNPEYSQSIKYIPLDISKINKYSIVPFDKYKFINNGNRPKKVHINVATAERGEQIKIVHSKNIKSDVKTTYAIEENKNSRKYCTIIGTIVQQDEGEHK